MEKIRHGRKHMARRMLINLYNSNDINEKKLAYLATSINKKDSFQWQFNKRKDIKKVGKEPIIPLELRYKNDNLKPDYSDDADIDDNNLHSIKKKKKKKKKMYQPKDIKILIH